MTPYWTSRDGRHVLYHGHLETTMRVLNLGAGVQSTAIYLMMLDGDLATCDVAIFADTGDEPAAVYEHVAFLESLKGPAIVRVSCGNLGDNLRHGVNSTGQRHVSIPTFLSLDGKSGGIGRRQCTKEYKVEPIEREIRRRIGCEGRPLPRGTTVTQVFGLSFDEPKRVARVRDLYRSRRGWEAEFPLFDEFLTRADCVAYLQRRLPGRHVPRSACVFCPYKTDAEWVRLRDDDPAGWSRAVEIDRAVRDETSACTRGMNATQFLHRSLVPLEEVVFDPKAADPQRTLSWSQMDCEGMCGH